MITMATKKRQNKLEKKIEDLQFEIAMLRSAMIGLIGEKDPEGEYRPEYVEKVLKAAREKEGSVIFEDVDAFFAKRKKK